MHCPFCAADDTKVIDSRLAAEGHQVRRRRECPSCGARFTTLESAVLTLPRVVKQDGTRQPFDGRKLRAGMMRSLEKRAVDTESVENAIEHILRKARAIGDREVSTLTVGGWVMEELRKLDEVAYVRFASVYRQFQDIDEFREEIELLKKQPTAEIVERQIELLGLDEALPAASTSNSKSGAKNSTGKMAATKKPGRGRRNS